ncbi:hypothetical protein P7C71_g1211, partial [Lecanoromycetidae sp. Uapishka_2]
MASQPAQSTDAQIKDLERQVFLLRRREDQSKKDLEEFKAAHDREKDELKATIDSLKRESRDIADNAAYDLREARTTHEAERNKAQDELDVYAESIKELQVQVNHMEDTIRMMLDGTNQDQASFLCRENGRLKTQVEGYENQIKRYETRIEAWEAKNQRLGRAEKSAIEYKRLITKLQRALISAREMIISLEAYIKMLQGKYTTLRGEVYQLRAQIGEYTKELVTQGSKTAKSFDELRTKRKENHEDNMAAATTISDIVRIFQSAASKMEKTINNGNSASNIAYSEFIMDYEDTSRSWKKQLQLIVESAGKLIEAPMPPECPPIDPSFRHLPRHRPKSEQSEEEESDHAESDHEESEHDESEDAPKEDAPKEDDRPKDKEPREDAPSENVPKEDGKSKDKEPEEDAPKDKEPKEDKSMDDKPPSGGPSLPLPPPPPPPPPPSAQGGQPPKDGEPKNNKPPGAGQSSQGDKPSQSDQPPHKKEPVEEKSGNGLQQKDWSNRDQSRKGSSPGQTGSPRVDLSTNSRKRKWDTKYFEDLRASSGEDQQKSAGGNTAGGHQQSQLREPPSKKDPKRAKTQGTDSDMHVEKPQAVDLRDDFWDLDENWKTPVTPVPIKPNVSRQKKQEVKRHPVDPAPLPCHQRTIANASRTDKAFRPGPESSSTLEDEELRDTDSVDMQG